MEVEFEKRGVWDVQVRKHLIISGVNGVVVDRYGLILWENEATGSRTVFKYLPGLRDTIKNQKIHKTSKMTENQTMTYFPYMFVYIYIYNIYI